MVKQLNSYKMIKYKNKEVLTAKEVSRYTGYSLGTIHTYTSRDLIPYSNPTGGKLLFNKADIDKWLEEKRGFNDDGERVEETTNPTNPTETTNPTPAIQLNLSENKKEVLENTYVGMVDTVYGSDGELHICQGNRIVTFDATDLFHWLDTIVKTTIKQRKDTDGLIMNNLKDTLDEYNAMFV